MLAATDEVHLSEGARVEPTELMLRYHARRFRGRLGTVKGYNETLGTIRVLWDGNVIISQLDPRYVCLSRSTGDST